MKRNVIALLFVSLILLCGFAAAEEYGFDYDNYAITQYSGTDTELVIPNEVGGCPVEAIYGETFYDNDALVSITLPDTLLELGLWNITDMDGLQSISLPESLVAIDSSNFVRCHSLSEVRIPARVSYIAQNCFLDCQSLTKISFEGPVPGIGSDCFEFLPEDAVIYVPDDQLDAYCAALPVGLNIQPSGANAIIYDFTAPEDHFTMEIDTGTIISYDGFATRVDIPAAIYGVEVRAIGKDAFKDHRYAYYVTIPEGVEVIDEGAFAGAAHLSCVKLPETLKEIKAGAFRGFKGNSVELPEGLEIIGEDAFADSILEGELHLPEGLKRIGNRAFAYSNYETICFPESIEEIGDEAFTGYLCSYLCFDGKDLPRISGNAFEGQEIYDVDINWQAGKNQMLAAQDFFDGIGQSARVWRMQNPNVDYINDYLDRYENGVMLGYDGTQTHIRPWDTYDDVTVTALGEGAFKGNTVIRYFSVPYNDEFTTIGAEAFADSSVETIDLFDSVTTIGAGAFRNCVNLKEITIPESVTSIASDAFEGCTGLEKITFLCDPGILSVGMLDDCAALTDVNGVPGADEEAQLELRFALYGMPEVTITRQPESVHAFEGEWAAVSIEAAGEELSYAWYVMPIWENEFTLDESCIDSVYGMHMDPENDCTEVYCVVTDAYGTSVTSETATFIMEEEEIVPVPVGAEGEPYFGTWKGISMEADGIAISFADLGMVMDITFKQDGTVDIFDGEETDTGVWYVADGIAQAMDSTMTILEDGNLCLEDEGMRMIFAREDGAGETETAVPAEDGGDERLNRKYVAESFTASGQTLDASMLGAEYSLLFRDDGTMDFVLAGTSVPNLPWSVEGNVYSIDQYGVILKAEATDAGFDLDFYGGMIVHFIPEE